MKPLGCAQHATGTNTRRQSILEQPNKALRVVKLNLWRTSASSRHTAAEDLLVLVLLNVRRSLAPRPVRTQGALVFTAAQRPENAWIRPRSDSACIIHSRCVGSSSFRIYLVERLLGLDASGLLRPGAKTVTVSNTPRVLSYVVHHGQHTEQFCSSGTRHDFYSPQSSSYPIPSVKHLDFTHMIKTPVHKRL